MDRLNPLKYALIFFACIAAISCTTLQEFISVADRDEAIPTTRVVREPVEVKIHTQGELQPLRLEPVVAPPVSGGTLQIIYIVKNGTHVKEGDTVVRFDPSEQEYNLEQNRSQLEEAEQKIKKTKVDQSVRVAKERVSLLSAESAVRRAALNIKGNSLLGKIEARKNEIAYEEAKRKLEQLKQDIRSNAVSDTAGLEAQIIARDRAMLMMQRAQENINNMTLNASMDGIVVMGQNIQALLGGGIIVSLSSIPEYKEGDQASPGQTIAQIQDIDQVEVRSKVLETDRGNLTPGQPAEIFLDFRPTEPFSGRIKSLAPSANSLSSISSALAMLESLSSRTFDITLEFDPGDEPIKLGTTARIIIQGQNVEDALSLPRQAIFQKDGRPVVYVKDAEDWRILDVQIKHLTESRAILEGIEEGTEVALVNPEQGERADSPNANPLISLRPGVNP
ncbi:MAG: efflux RND transporter periplasmic adaptor subunit [Acidobacteriota bacterium]